MNGQIKRQKIMEREHFTYEEKMKFAAKSDDRCCHCGKKVFINYGATVEHFIPLSKGGTNRDINMIMLCKECNEEKNNFIYRPDDYLLYLKQDHLDKINGYFNSYIKSFDFVNRDNLLACDRYKVLVNALPDNVYYSLKKRMKKKKDLEKVFKKHNIELWVKRATMDDVDKLTEYYIKYLKKYDCLDSENAARINIEFWLTFGCIYYIERNNEIETFITVMVTKSNGKVYISDDNIDHFLTMNVFSYYANDFAFTLSYNLSRHIPRCIAEEQGLKQIPVKYCILDNDKLCEDICDGGSVYHGDRFLFAFMVLYGSDRDELPKIKEDENLKNFFHKFEQVNKSKTDKWFKEHNENPYEWMLNELELINIEEEEDVSDN